MGSTSAPYDSEDENEEVVFYLPWVTVAEDTEKRATIAVGFLLDWALEDVIAGRLTIEEVRKMFDITEKALPHMTGQDGKNFIEKLKEREPGTMFSFLFPLVTAPEMPNENRCGPLSHWLRNPPRGQRNKRLFCLLMLRDTRQHHFAVTARWDSRITELNYLLEFYRTLPIKIQEIDRRHVGLWYSEMTMTYMAEIGSSPDLMNAVVYTRLRDAEMSCRSAVEGLRETNQLNPLALQLRYGAQICLLKIRRLEQQLSRLGKSAITTKAVRAEMDLLCATGLKMIEESDKIRTASEVQANWLEGVEGLYSRHNLLSFHRNHWTSVIAVDLFMASSEIPSQEKVDKCWTWVQKYKARSLARTIGVGGAIPPGLENQIMQSELARPLYQQMLDLDNRIQEAEPKERFYLRRELDSHRIRMKEIRILKPLIDLRKGNPLSTSDIATIQAGISRSIVLIDWLYVPPYPDNATGTLLILTAKANAPITLDVVSTTMESVNRWRKDCLHPKTLGMDEARQSFETAL
jgi:hypothetical protein